MIRLQTGFYQTRRSNIGKVKEVGDRCCPSLGAKNYQTDCVNQQCCAGKAGGTMVGRQEINIRVNI